MHHRVGVIYHVTPVQKMISYGLGPLLIIGVIGLLTYLFPLLAPSGTPVSLDAIILAAFATCMRLAIAYTLSMLVAIPLAIFVTLNPTIEAFFLPIFDVLQSVPILVLFPVLIVLFVSSGWLNAAAIAVLFLTMLWTIVFTLVGGIHMIPRDIIYAARIFGLSGFAYVRRLLLPAIVPQMVTGTILAFAQGWNIIIVAEVLHTYIPNGTSTQDVFGIGAILVEASANAQNEVFLLAVIVMIVIIAFLNFFIWQNLLIYAHRFRFE